ncbi:MAG TPA: CopG family transcriptional regulator [Thermoanaerobaculia bacterium]|nr:CopG family transcriptional regulator [Thermoanaerobaculia bacterium]
MTILTLDLDPETEAKLEQVAKESGVTTSFWVAELIRERTSSAWPEEVRRLFGSWSDEDFPSIEEIRAGQPEDLLRESL